MLQYAREINNCSNREQYRDLVQKNDQQFGDIVAALDGFYNSQDTVVVYASDHGAVGKWSAYEAGLRVAMVIRCTGKMPSISTNAMVSFVDILPTVIDLSGILQHSAVTASFTDTIDEVNLVPYIQNLSENNLTTVHNYIYGVSTRQNVQTPDVFPSRSIRNERYKLIVNFNSFDRFNVNKTRQINAGSSFETSAFEYFVENSATKYQDIPEVQLFDLVSDPWETQNIADSEQEIVSTMKERLIKWMTSQGDFLSNGEMPLLQILNS